MNPNLKEDLTLLKDVIKSIRRKLQNREYNKKRYNKKKNHIKHINLLYYFKHKMQYKDKRREYHIKYFQKNKEKLKTSSKKYFQKNKEKIYLRRKEYNKKPIVKEKIKNYNKQYGKKYFQKNKHKKYNYIKNKLKLDINFKLATRLRCRLADAIRGNFKSGSAVRDLGCTIPELKQYLESKFQDGMTWDNWTKNGWHIDHIKPISSFDLTNREQLLEACHYTNLQPLWAKDNLSKGDSI